MKQVEKMCKSMRNASLGITALLAMVLTACASQYEAPIDDRSDTLRREAPVIVSNGESVDATLRRQPASINQGNRAANTGSTSNSSASTSPGSAQGNGQVGASSTVVRAVNLGGGISRNTTRNAPSPASLDNADNVDNEGTDASQAAPISRQAIPASPSSNSATSSQQSAPSVASRTTADVQAPMQQQAPVQQTPAQQNPLSATSTSTGTQHRVARGDTLYSIAWRHNMDVRSLALVNGLSEPYTIYPGQVLQIENAPVSSETLESVADIPVSPAGEEIAAGQRPQAAIDGRRVGSVNERDVEGVTWQWPSDGRLLSMFNTSGTARGIDIAGTQGDSVFASAEGDVVYAGTGIQGAGNLVILRHSARHLSAYMHNSRLLVSEGDFVQGGDKIAEVGTGPDGRDLLHFEVRLDGKPVNPVRYLPNR